MVHLTNIKDIEKAIADNHLCLFYIKAPDCGVCNVMLDKVERLADSITAVYSFYTDITEEPLIAGQFLVYSGPTVLLLMDGKEVYRASQFIDLEELQYNINRYNELIDKTKEGNYMVNYGLKDKVALITGANNPQGIGATTAFAFAREGAKVVLIYKRIHRQFDQSKTDENGVDRYFEANSGNADRVESRLKEMNADYMILESDISNEDTVKEIYSKVLERYGKVDILVNNAADGDMDGIDTIEKITQNVIDDTFAVNVRGSILMTREMITHRGDYGRIINISTDASQVFAGQIAYGASKATLEALTRSIALEVAKYGITVNCVAPGPTQTGWIDTDLEQSVLPVIPMGKLIQPEDIAETILFLASEQARMLTGQVIKVSGGHAL